MNTDILLNPIKNVSKEYYSKVKYDIDTYLNDSPCENISDFLFEYLKSDKKNFFTICSKESFSNLENETEGYTFIYTPLNDHSRIHLHKGDIVFCYRQGQFLNLDEALDKRGIYGVGLALSDPFEIYTEKKDHERWGIAITLPVIMKQHLELRNIQMYPYTINLTPYNGNRNDALQYIESSNHYKSLLALISARDGYLKNSLSKLTNIDIENIQLPDIFWKDKTPPINQNNERETIKNEFKYYLTNFIRSSRKNDKGFNLTPNAIESFLIYIEPQKLFDYNLEKWNYIESIYDINSTRDVNHITQQLLSDSDFVNRDKADNQGWRSGAIINYALFIRSREYYTKKKIKTEYLFHTPIKDSLQKIWYGAPGTGKSKTIKDKTQGRKTIRTTFHPDTDYASFVGCYKPTKEVVGDETRITYKFVPQSFVKAYLGAWKAYTERPMLPEPQFLVIEEINRGNCAQIFGDIFQLLDRDADNGFSTYPIEADTDLQQELEERFKSEEYNLASLDIEGIIEDYTSNYGATLSEDVKSGRILLLPPNLYIWATMNTSDQSLFPIDSAFKRRWDWQYVPVEDSGEEWKIVVREKTEEVKEIEVDWWEFLAKINEEISSKTASEDKQLGYFFCKADNDKISADRFVNKVLFYLYNDVFKTEEMPACFKGKGFKDFFGQKRENSLIELFTEMGIIKEQAKTEETQE